MKLLRGLAQYYVDLLMKLGLVRFSLLLASGLVVLAMVVQIAVTMLLQGCLLYTSPSPRDRQKSRMPSSA